MLTCVRACVLGCIYVSNAKNIWKMQAQCHVMSCHVLVMSCHVISCRGHVMHKYSYVTMRNVMSCKISGVLRHMAYTYMSTDAMSCHVMSWSCHAMACRVVVIHIYPQAGLRAPAGSRQWDICIYIYRIYKR